ncbi:MAG: transposase family protein, partial [Polaribacter sp.]
TKKNPNPTLTKEQKEHNSFVAKHRIKVENAIGGTKRYNILTQKFRNKSTLLRDKAIFLAAGLWNKTKGFQV